MPSFFLHYIIDDCRIEDCDGHELRDLKAAKREAVLGVRSIQGNRLLSGMPLQDGHVEIVGARGQPLARVCLMEALQVALDEDISSD